MTLKAAISNGALLKECSYSLPMEGWLKAGVVFVITSPLTPLRRRGELKPTYSNVTLFTRSVAGYPLLRRGAGGEVKKEWLWRYVHTIALERGWGVSVFSFVLKQKKQKLKALTSYATKHKSPLKDLNSLRSNSKSFLTPQLMFCLTQRSLMP